MTEEPTRGTVVFTDLVGFTEYTGARGDSAAVEVLDRVRAVADATVAVDGRGRVVKELGDGLMLWFDDAATAEQAVGDFVHAIVAGRADGSFPLAVRVGAHHGEVRPRGADLVGQTVNIAARIVDLAGPMEIVVSEEFVLATGASEQSRFEPVGPTIVKGVSEPLWLYRVAFPAPQRQVAGARG